jgi:hypothetical protein
MLESLRNGRVKIIGYQFGAKFKFVFCAKYDRGLDFRLLGNTETFEMDKCSFIQHTQYFIPVEIDLSVVPARLGI